MPSPTILLHFADFKSMYFCYNLFKNISGYDFSVGGGTVHKTYSIYHIHYTSIVPGVLFTKELYTNYTVFFIESVHGKP